MPIRAFPRLLVIIVLASAIVGCSQSVDGLLAEGEAAAANRDYRTALIHLKSVLQRDPDNARGRWLLAEIYLELESGADAEKEIRRAAQAGVGNDAVLPALAHALLLQGKSSEVLTLESPDGLSVQAQSDLAAVRGLAHLSEGNDAEADGLTVKALELAAGGKLALMARTRVLANANRFDEAERVLLDLQAAHPGYAVAWSLMGDIKDARGELKEAEQAYSAAITKRALPHEDLLKRAFVRFRQQDLAGALADSTRLNSAVPKLQLGWYLTGAGHFLSKDFAKAQEALDRSAQLDAGHLPTVILLGWTNLNLGNSNQAAALAERAMALGPNVIASRLLMATLHLSQSEPRRAEDLLRPVVTAVPDNLPVKSLLVASLQAQGKAVEAASILEELAAANPDSLDVQTSVGLELIRAREPEKALAVLDRVVVQAPTDPRISGARVAALIQEERFDDALAAARSFLDENPENPLALQAWAAAQLARGDLTAAVEAFRQVLKAVPRDPAVSLMLADLLTRSGGLTEASQVLSEAAEAHPSDARLQTSKARLALLQGDGIEAVKLLRQVLDENPSHRPAQMLLGRQLLAQNDPIGALEVLPGEADSKDPDLLTLRADVRWLAGDAEGARDELERLVLLQPQSAQAHFKLALAYAELGDIVRREKALEEAARLDPTDVGISITKARSLSEQGRNAEAHALLNSLGLPETDPRRLKTELLIAVAGNDHDGRLRLAQQLQMVSPSAENTLLLAQAQYARGQVEAAETSLKTWLAQHPGSDDVALQLAVLYGRIDRPGEAIAILRPLAARSPENAAVLNNLAWYLRDVDPGESLAFAERAAALAPDNPAIMNTYTTALAANRQYERALRVVDAAIQKAPRSSQLRLQRVELLEASGDTDAATRELRALEAGGVPAPLRERFDELLQRLATR